MNRGFVTLALDTPVDHYITLLRILIFTTCLLLLTRMMVSGLVRVYPWFFAYVLAEALRLLASFQVTLYSPAYNNQWKVSNLVKAVLMVFVVLEMYRVALAGTPALARYSQRVAVYVILAGGVLSGLGLLLFGTGSTVVETTIHNYFAFLRTMDCWMLFLVAAVVWFVLWFPVPLSRNALLYILIFGVFFLSEASTFFVAGQLTLYQARGVRMAAFTVNWLCLLCWTIALGGRGGFSTRVVGHWWNKSKVECLTAQLERINQSLERIER